MCFFQIKKGLENAFDDLSDDYDDSVDIESSHQFSNNNLKTVDSFYKNQHNFKPIETKSPPILKQVQPNSDVLQEEIIHLKNVIESKDRETRHITERFNDERKKVDNLQKRLAVAEAEKERSNMTRQQTHELLVESKEKNSELEDSIKKLRV